MGFMPSNMGTYTLTTEFVGSRTPWRILKPLPAALQKSHQNGGRAHQNGGRVVLIFVADPTGSPAPSEASVGTTRRVEEGWRKDALAPTCDRTDRYRGSYFAKLPCRPWLDVARPKGKHVRADKNACAGGALVLRPSAPVRRPPRSPAIPGKVLKCQND